MPSSTRVIWRDTLLARLGGIPILVAVRGRLLEAAVVAVALIPVSAIAGYSRFRIYSAIPLDYSVFGPTGADILRGRWDLVYRSPINAGGPFELVPYGIAYLLHVSGQIQWTIFYACLTTVLIFALGVVLLAPMAHRPGRTAFLITLGIGAIGIFSGTVTGAADSGHIAELMIPLLWLLGGWMARDRNFVACGITIGLSVGFETWGVLGFVLAFAVARPRVVVTALAGIATIAVTYLPFVATGSFHLFSLKWPVLPDTIYAIVLPNVHRFTWEFRAFQSIFALALGFAVALLTRRSPYSVALVALALIAGRLAVDPLLLTYYWVSPAAVALVVLAGAVYTRAWIPAAVAGLLVVALWLPRTWPLVDAFGLLVLAVTCAIVVRATRPPLAE